MKQKTLNEAQQAAAEHYMGPALTLAGPGSGKTTVLIERTLRIAAKSGAPSRILSVTFTNAAGCEMSERYCIAANAYFGTETNFGVPVFQTVHSFCNGLIREYESLKNLHYKRIEGEHAQKGKILSDIYCEVNGVPADGRMVQSLISGMGIHVPPEIKNLKKIKSLYYEYKKQHMLIDFDDMIQMALEILSSHSDQTSNLLRERFQKRFSFIQIDEAQDLTQEQFQIMQLVGSHKNLFVVADDDQSIYGFRGAAPQCLQEFCRSYLDCRLYYLTQNYRSVQSIVKASDLFIAQNRGRFEKKLYSETLSAMMPCIKALKNSAAQAEFIEKEIKKLCKNGKRKMSVGILYRNNLSGLLLSVFFAKQHILCRKQGGIPKISSLAFVDDVLKEILKSERDASCFIPAPSSVFRRLTENGLHKRFEAYCRKTGEHARYKDSVLALLSYLCDVCNSHREMVTLLDQAEAESACKNAENYCELYLSTVHSAKGLEYDAVFVIDLLDGEFPGSGADTGALLEEERRLFYVAITRARQFLYLTYPLHRGCYLQNGTLEKESIFVREFRQCLQMLRRGDSLDEK